jgi:hypothetical protein
MAKDFEAAKAKTEQARPFVLKRQKDTMKVVNDQFT